MPPQQLRDYQLRGLAQILDAFKEGARTVLAVAPTGSGKTSCFASLVSDLARNRQPSVILVHRRELATQACNRLTEFGTDYGLIMADEVPKPYAPVQVASVPTLARRTVFPRAKLVVCDEAHLSTAATWRKVLDQYPDAKILGVTATPWRLSGKPLAGAYDQSVVVATPRELREQGHLCPFVGFSFKTPDLSGVKTTADDYNQQQAAAVMSDSVIVNNIVEKWLESASHLSTVVFAVTVEHSKQLTEKFKAAGVSAEHLDGQTPKFERDAILKRVAEGKTLVLSNCGVCVEGLDIPRLKCCVLARPTKSLARAIQMMGRVRRPWNGVTARIHDHAFVIRSHGLPDDDRDYSLEAKKERPKELSQCGECFAFYEPGQGCPYCGMSASEAVEERVIKTVEDAEQYEFSSDTQQTQEKDRENVPPTEIRWSTIGRMIEGVFAKTWEEQTAYGKQKRYLVKSEKRTYSVPGTTRLNSCMGQVEIGSKVRITYKGDTQLPGGKVRKEFKVEVDDFGPAPKATGACEQCGKTFDYPSPNVKRRFCSENCRKAQREVEARRQEGFHQDYEKRSTAMIHAFIKDNCETGAGLECDAQSLLNRWLFWSNQDQTSNRGNLFMYALERVFPGAFTEDRSKFSYGCFVFGTIKGIALREDTREQVFPMDEFSERHLIIDAKSEVQGKDINIAYNNFWRDRGNTVRDSGASVVELLCHKLGLVYKWGQPVKGIRIQNIDFKEPRGTF